MPNHVTTILKVSPPVAEAFTRTRTEEERLDYEAREIERKEWLSKIGREKQYTYEPLDMEARLVDFNLVIPEPDDMFHGGCNGQHPHPKEDGGFYEHCWYHWNIDNWGTKWGAYDSSLTVEGDVAVVKFDTAWSHPIPVIKALSEKFPEESFDVMYADEDLGYNVGAYTMKNGQFVQEADLKFGSDEANELAAQIKHGKTYAEVSAEWED